MYAIVDIGGQQLKVEKEDKVCINRIKGEVGTKVELDKVLFINNEGDVKLGTPYLKDAIVTCKILSHFKDKKIRIFKKKNRKGYKVLNGHRQFLTEILVEDISDKKTARQAKAEKEEPQKAATVKKEATPAPQATEKQVKSKSTATKKAAVVKKEEKASPEAKKGAQVKAVAGSKEKAKTSAAKKKPARTKKPAGGKQSKSAITKK
jgi:large subunit ribosomal protein L21